MPPRSRTWAKERSTARRAAHRLASAVEVGDRARIAQPDSARAYLRRRGDEDARLVVYANRPRSAPARPRRDSAPRPRVSQKASPCRIRRPDGSAPLSRRRCRDRPHAPVCRPDASPFILAAFALGSVGLFQSAFDSVLPLRLRSNRARSSALGVSIPLSFAIPVSISRWLSPLSRARSCAAPHYLHRRAVDVDPLALHQAVLRNAFQSPAKHLLVRLVRQTRTGPRQPRMIGDLVAVRQPQEIAQREGIRATPGDARSPSIPSK